MRSPRQALVSPDAFASGEIGGQTSTHDRYFVSEQEPTLRIVMDHFMSKIPEPQKSSVEMCIMAGLTYEEAAEKMSAIRGIKTHKKTVWRWTKQGVNMLGEMFKAAGWASAISPKVPDYE